MIGSKVIVCKTQRFILLSRSQKTKVINQLVVQVRDEGRVMVEDRVKCGQICDILIHSYNQCNLVRMGRRSKGQGTNKDNSGLLVCTSERRCHSLRWGTLKKDQCWESRQKGNFEVLFCHIRRNVSRQLGILVWSLEERPGWNHLVYRMQLIV